MNITTFLPILRDTFHTQISRKTGWGKNEIMHEFDHAVIDSLVKALQEANSEGPAKQDSNTDPHGPVGGGSGSGPGVG